MKKFRELLEGKKTSLGCIIAHKQSRSTKWVGTVEDLTDAFSYTLKVGAAYASEKGNKKINVKPKTVKALVKELEKSQYNSGNSGYYEYGTVTDEDITRYEEEGSFSEKI
jgi:hypothetical protein